MKTLTWFVLLLIGLTCVIAPIMSDGISIIGSVDTPGRAGDLYVDGNYAYVTDYNEGVQIIDVSDPTNPTIISTITTIGTASDVFIVGSYAYVANCYSGSLEIVDISNPSSPVTTGTINTGSCGLSAFVSGSYAYVGDDDSGDGQLWIIDISNPTSPAVVSTVQFTSFAKGVYASGSYVYVANGWDGFRVVNVADHNNPYTVGSLDPADSGDFAWNVHVSGSYAYLANGNGGLQIIDVSDPANPSVAGQASGTYGYDVYVSTPYAYVGGNNKVSIFDVSDPVNPVLLGSVATPNACWGVFAKNDILYIGATHAGFFTATWNAAPVGTDDTYSTNEDSPLNVNAPGVLVNDTDADNDGLSVESIDTALTAGSVTHNADGSFSYDPSGQFESLAEAETATDTFSYDISDGNGGFGSATVTITIDGLNDQPDAPSGLTVNGVGGNPNDVSDYTPTFAWSAFSDVDNGDFQGAFQVWVGLTAGASDYWGYTGNSDSSVVYAGNDLDPNVTIYWQVRVEDQYGAFSGWTTGTFEILDIGLRTYDGTENINIGVGYVSSLSPTDLEDPYYSLRIRKGGTTYYIILLDQGDPDASKIRIETSDSTPNSTKYLKKM